MGNQNPIHSLVFIPPQPPTYTETRPRQVEYITTKSKKKIPLYYIPCHDKFTEENTRVLDEDEGEVVEKIIRTTILYSHGNATDIGQMNDFLNLLHENLPVNICHYEYIGYGLSQRDNQPSEEQTYESIEAAHQYLKKKKGVVDREIICWGTSLGSGPTVELCSRGKDFCGVLLEVPFTSCCRVVEMVKKNRLLTNVLESTVDMFVNIQKIHKVTSPVMVIHGKDDTVVPFIHGKELWDKVDRDFKYKNLWVDRADHHDIITTMGTREYIQEIRSFIEFCENTQKKGGVKRSHRVAKKKKKGWILTCSGVDDVEDYLFSPDEMSPGQRGDLNHKNNNPRHRLEDGPENTKFDD